MDDLWREIREKQEDNLSKFACKSTNTKGRMVPEKKCLIRTDYERDGNRILYSVEFRRLRHKTQVFFNAKNDHICTRMEHVLYVGSISSTIVRTLNLNQDLTYAIALGHDLGHAPFGHSGERVLNSCIHNLDPSLPKFRHELNSLRVIDRLASRISSDGKDAFRGLNLTFEVRDGIVSHCGEKYGEYKVSPDRLKKPEDLENMIELPEKPYSLEACVVRLVDKIAYVGRDVEDALRVKLIDINDIPKDIKEELGVTNGEIINTLVFDLVKNSYNNDYIALSPEKGEALARLITENNRLIYKSDKIQRYEKAAQNIIEGLFNHLNSIADDLEMLEASDLKVDKFFHHFITHNGLSNESSAQKSLDYIAGMTDNFAMTCYDEIYAL